MSSSLKRDFLEKWSAFVCALGRLADRLVGGTACFSGPTRDRIGHDVAELSSRTDRRLCLEDPDLVRRRHYDGGFRRRMDQLESTLSWSCHPTTGRATDQSFHILIKEPYVAGARRGAHQTTRKQKKRKELLK